MRSYDWKLRRRSLPRPAHGLGAFFSREGMEAPAYHTVPNRHFCPPGGNYGMPAVITVNLDPEGDREVLDPLQTIRG